MNPSRSPPPQDEAKKQIAQESEAREREGRAASEGGVDSVPKKKKVSGRLEIGSTEKT